MPSTMFIFNVEVIWSYHLKLNDIFLYFFSSLTGETATKEIHLQNAPEQSPETLAPRQVAPSDSILEEAEEDEEHKTQNASPSSCQSDGFKIPVAPVSIAFMYIWSFLCYFILPFKLIAAFKKKSIYQCKTW